MGESQVESVTEMTHFFGLLRSLSEKQDLLEKTVSSFTASQSALSPQAIAHAKSLANELNEIFDEDNCVASYVFLLKKKFSANEKFVAAFWTPTRKKEYDQAVINEEVVDVTSDTERIDHYVTYLENQKLVAKYSDLDFEKRIQDLQQELKEEKANVKNLAERLQKVSTMLNPAMEEKERLVKEVQNLKREREELVEWKETTKKNVKRIHKETEDKRKQVNENVKDGFSQILDTLRQLKKEVNSVISDVQDRQEELGNVPNAAFKQLDLDLSSAFIKNTHN